MAWTSDTDDDEACGALEREGLGADGWSVVEALAAGCPSLRVRYQSSLLETVAAAVSGRIHVLGSVTLWSS